MSATVSYQFILFEKRDHIALVTFNRPEVMNAVHPEMDRELCHAWETVRDDPDVWVAILTGAGDRAFTVGADLKWWGREGVALPRSQHWQLALRFGGLVNFELWKPVIAAVNGYCLGGGLEIVLACDLVVATTTATFGLPEVRTTGAPPGSGGALRLPRQIPKGAMEPPLTGEPIGTEEALRWGLINAVAPPEDLLPRTIRLAEAICRNSPLAVRATKELALRGLELPLYPSTAWDLYARVNQSLYDSADFRSNEASRAFLEKRPPKLARAIGAVRAIRVGTDGLRLVEADRLSLGPTDVLVTVEACGVCYHDYLVGQGLIAGANGDITLGHEVAGTIAEIGAAVSNLAVGDFVALTPRVGCLRCRACLTGREPQCPQPQATLGFDVDGGYAECVRVPEAAAVVLPRNRPSRARRDLLLCDRDGTERRPRQGRDTAGGQGPGDRGGRRCGYPLRAVGAALWGRGDRPDWVRGEGPGAETPRCRRSRCWARARPCG